MENIYESKKMWFIMEEKIQNRRLNKKLSIFILQNFTGKNKKCFFTWFVKSHVGIFLLGNWEFRYVIWWSKLKLGTVVQTIKPGPYQSFR